ncbi:cobalt ABC transporter ATP-binding protein, partial [Enterococcus faecalis]
AMEATGYQGAEGRTRYRILHWHLRDTIVMFGFVFLTIGLFVLRT